MASQVEIVNYALGLLGESPITAITDDSQKARLANRTYALVRDAVLAEHPWNFAIRRQTLAALATAPDFGFNYEYTLPTDPYCLRAYMINGDIEDRNSGDLFRVEGRKLRTNASSVNLLYIAKVTNEGDWSPSFYRAFGVALAADMAYALTGSREMEAEMEGKYERYMRRARSADGLEGTPEQFDDNTLTSVR